MIGQGEQRPASSIRIVAPTQAHGPRLAELIRRSPPLDANSDYCYLLLCTHFAATSAVAEGADGVLLGGVTAYRLPERPETLFIWQLVVASEARGLGLAGRLVESVAARAAATPLRWIETTVSPGNGPSNAVFDRFAARRGVTIARQPCFDPADFTSDHEAEVLLRLGPFPS